MTIAGFWGKLSEFDVSDERVPLRIYAERYYKEYGRPLRVGIDAYMWLCELSPQINQQTHLTGPEVLSKLILNFHSRIRELILLNISFVFVFDGIFKVKKRRWGTTTSDGNDDICEYSFCPPAKNFDEAYKAVNSIISKKPLSCAVLDLPEVVKIKELLDLWNISYVQAPAEAEAELGRLNLAGVIDAVISNDGDGFMFGTQVMLRNFSKWVPDFPSTWFPTGHPITQQTEFYVTPIRMERIESKTGLTRGRLICVSCLSGNDFSEGALGLGVVRAFHLAQIGTKCEHWYDVDDKTKDGNGKKAAKKVDFSRLLAKIFVNKDPMKYTLRIPPDDTTGRKQKLRELTLLLNTELENRSKAYFGRAFNFEKQIGLPSDFYFMIHFYPLLAPYVYFFPPYATNNAEDMAEDGFQGCGLPQISKKDFHDSKEVIRFSRGTNQGKLGYSYFDLKEYDSTNDEDLIKYTDRFKERGSLAWFERPDFKRMCELRLPISKSTREFLLKFLSEAYAFRAVMNLEYFLKNKDDIFVNSFKIRDLPVKHKGDKSIVYKWKTELYQLKYDEKVIFGDYLVSADSDLIYDDNYNLVPSKKSSYVWIQKYILESVDTGRKLIAEYETRTKKKRETYKKGSPRKRGRRYPKQSTNLINLKNSPIKLTPKKSDAEIIDNTKLKPLPALKFVPSRPASKAAGSQSSTDTSFWLSEPPTSKRLVSKQVKARDQENNEDILTWFEPSNKRNRLEKVPGLPRMESNSVSLDKEYDHLVQVSPHDNCSKAGTNTEPIAILDSDEETDFEDLKTNNSINDDLKETSARDLSSSLIVLANEHKRAIEYKGHENVITDVIIDAGDNKEGTNSKHKDMYGKKRSVTQVTSEFWEDSSALLSETDSSIHDAEDEINDILGI